MEGEQETKNEGGSAGSVSKQRRRALGALGALARRCPADRRTAQALGIAVIAIARADSAQALEAAAEALTAQAR